MKNMNIKHKLFIFIFIGAFLTSGLGLLFVQMSQYLYNEIIYRETSEKFYLFSKRIEDEMKAIDQLSLVIMSDPDVQQYLKTIKKGADTYEAYTAANNLRKKLDANQTYSSAVVSIEIIDWFNNSHSVGLNATYTDYKLRKEIQDSASIYEGAAFWEGGLLNEDYFYSLRQIRETTISSLQPLGTLIMHTDAEKMIYSSANERYRYGSTLLIKSGEQFIYPTQSGINVSDLDYDMNNNYSFVKLNDQRYLSAQFTLDYTGWTFIYLVPYGSIFENVRTMKTVLISLYIIILLVILWFGLKISRGITLPLERLTAKMSVVEKGQLETDRLEILERDEIGKLSRNFDRMVAKLNVLIQEDYIKQIMLKEAEYETLKAKINPHFLYNTLESINWLAKMKGQPQISNMVKALGDLLRNAVNEREFISVHEEIMNLDNYIMIQRFRFEERLNYHLHIPDELHSLYMPNFILQPIVENAIKYGVEDVQGQCEIKVAMTAENQRLTITVEDTGPGMDENYLEKLKNDDIQASGTGIGLRSIDERLKVLYGSNYGIRIVSNVGKGTTIVISIPHMKQPHPSEARGSHE